VIVVGAGALMEAERSVLECIRGRLTSLGNLRQELYWEIEYNDRNEKGNESALALFRVKALCGVVAEIPKLCATVVALANVMDEAVEQPEMERLLKAVEVAASETRMLFRKSLKGEQEVRDNIVQLYGRIYYLYEKFYRLKVLVERSLLQQ